MCCWHPIARLPPSSLPRASRLPDRPAPGRARPVMARNSSAPEQLPRSRSTSAHQKRPPQRKLRWQHSVHGARRRPWRNARLRPNSAAGCRRRRRRRRGGPLPPWRGWTGTWSFDAWQSASVGKRKKERQRCLARRPGTARPWRAGRSASARNKVDGCQLPSTPGGVALRCPCSHAVPSHPRPTRDSFMTCRSDGCMRTASRRTASRLLGALACHATRPGLQFFLDCDRG